MLITFFVVGSYENDISMLTASTDFFTKVKSITIRQIDVQERNIKFVFFQMGYSVLVVIGRCDFILHHTRGFTEELKELSKKLETK